MRYNAGYQLDNDSKGVEFDVSGLLFRVGEGASFAVHYQRFGDANAYAVNASQIAVADNKLTWTPLASDLSVSGHARLQIKATNGTKIAMSPVYDIVIGKSLTLSSDN